GPDVRSSAAVLPVDDNNLISRQRDIRIYFGNFRIVPRSDLSKVDSRQCLRCEVQLFYSGKIENWNVGPQRGREMKQLTIPVGAEVAHLNVVQRTVGAGEVYGPYHHVMYSCSGAVRHIRKPNIRIDLPVFFDPLRVHRRSEGRTVALDLQYVAKRCTIRSWQRRRQEKQHDRGQFERKVTSHGANLH